MYCQSLTYLTDILTNFSNYHIYFFYLSYTDNEKKKRKRQGLQKKGTLKMILELFGFKLGYR